MTIELADVIEAAVRGKQALVNMEEEVLKRQIKEVKEKQET